MLLYGSWSPLAAERFFARSPWSFPTLFSQRSPRSNTPILESKTFPYVTRIVKNIYPLSEIPITCKNCPRNYLCKSQMFLTKRSRIVRLRFSSSNSLVTISSSSTSRLLGNLSMDSPSSVTSWWIITAASGIRVVQQTAKSRFCRKRAYRPRALIRELEAAGLVG
jgi:hypothetical protein